MAFIFFLGGKPKSLPSLKGAIKAKTSYYTEALKY